MTASTASGISMTSLLCLTSECLPSFVPAGSGPDLGWAASALLLARKGISSVSLSDESLSLLLLAPIWPAGISKPHACMLAQRWRSAQKPLQSTRSCSFPAHLRERADRTV